MNEQPLPPASGEAYESVVDAPQHARRDLLPWLVGIGFIVLAGAIFYLWQYPGLPAEAVADATAIQTVEKRLDDTDTRLTRLEQRPAPDVEKLSAQIEALDGRIGDQTRFSSQLDTLSGRVQALAGRNQTDIDAAKQQIDALTRQVAALKANAGDLELVTKRLSLIAKLQEASFALDSGRPVGDLPGAPDALSRYAHAAPPTEAQLRLRFSRDERAALGAEQPKESNAPFIDRVWDRAQGLITVRRGDDIVVGNPAATILGHAQVALDAGDIAAAVNAVEALAGEPAQAMAKWLADAKSLLAARAALAGMAGQA